MSQPGKVVQRSISIKAGNKVFYSFDEVKKSKPFADYLLSEDEATKNKVGDWAGDDIEQEGSTIADLVAKARKEVDGKRDTSGATKAATSPPPKGDIYAEEDLYGSGKHGLKWTEAKARAINDDQPQGQFTRAADIEFAVRCGQDLGKGNTGFYALPTNHGCVVHLVAGGTVPAEILFVKVYENGKVHSYPARKADIKGNFQLRQLPKAEKS
jgi:hypothetical protein